MENNDQFMNPTDEQRHQMLLDALTLVGRQEDYDNIVELLSPPPDIVSFVAPMALRNVKIGIIGGGLAGLAAAYELRKLGADITIFDAQKDRVGGRVYTHYFDRSGQYYGELGAMRVPVSHETTWHYINLFRLNTESLASPRSNNFIYVHNVRIRRDRSGQNITQKLYPYYQLTEEERNTPWDELSRYATNAMLYNLSPQLRTEILKILPEYSEQYAAITRLSNRQIFEMLGLSQGAINLLSSVEPFTGAFLNISHDEIMNGNYSLDFLNTYRLQGGAVHLPLAFYDSLLSDDPPEIDFPTYFLGKVTVNSRHVVNGIIKDPENEGVYLRYTNEKKGNHIEPFDYVICALPYTTLRDIEIMPYFSNQKMQAIREYHYMDGQKTLFLCKERFWEEDSDYGRINGGISFTDLPIQSILYPPDHIRCREQEFCSPKEPGVLTAAYNLGQDPVRLSNQPESRRFYLIKRNVEEVHGLPPEYLDMLVDEHKTVHWNTQDWARGAFAAGYPGQKVLFLYEMQKPEYDDRLFFAGEHISVKQGWMQGALYSGKTVANKLAEKALTR